jgi:hypothetical protein
MPLRARVGIGTGLVVVGDLMGEGEARERGVVGETPNLAARLQALAESGTVVIGPSTRRLTGGLFEYEDLGPVEIKGLAAPVEAARVLRESEAESRFEALRAGRTPLVGRDEELALLQRRWQQAKIGEGCVVLVSGEPGIGKSRLAQTLIDRLAGEPHTRLRSFCSPHHQDSALYPMITQLERAAGFRREDTADQRLDKLEAVLAQATNDLGEAAPLIAALLSLPTGERYPPLALTPQRQKEKTLQALAAQVEGLAARTPVLTLFEDAHWSDPTSLDLYDLIIDRVPALRVLLIITFRPKFTPPWTGRPHVTSLGLNRLAPRQRAEMITSVTGGKALPQELTDQIIDRTDGVPLFVEELTKAVVESGMLTDVGDHYTATGSLMPLAIPATLQASLLARLDRLAPVREVAQIGAALGRHFSHELIAAVVSMPSAQLENALAQLVDAELVYRRGAPPEAEYTFKHALVQDAAYSTLLRSRRLQLHAQIAATLESRFPEIASAQPALLAQHCFEGGQNEKAVGYLLEAGRQAVARAAMTEAVAQLRRGLDLLRTLPDSPWRQQCELDLGVALGPALFATRGYAPDVGQTLARGLALVKQLDRPDYLAPLLFGQWRFHHHRADYKLALSFAEQLEQIGEARNDDAARLLGKFVQAYTRFQRGEITSARALCERSRGLSNPVHRGTYAAMTVEDPHVIMTGVLALALTGLGYVDQGRAKIDEALAEARRLDNASTLAATLIQACRVTMTVASPRDVLRYAKEIETLSRVHSLPVFLAWGSVYRGWSLTVLGQTWDGPAMLAKGLSDIRTAGSIAGSPWALVMLAETHAKLARPDESLNCLSEAATIIEMTDARIIEAALHRLRGELLSATGDKGAAERSYCQALEVARRQEAKLWELLAATSLARLWRDQGKRTEARDLLAPVYAWFTEGFDTPVLQEAKALLEELGADPRAGIGDGVAPEPTSNRDVMYDSA